MAKKDLYREKSVDKFTSADELNNYTKANHPSLWVLLSALLCIAVGFLIWTFVGDISITVSASASVEDDIATLYIHNEEAKPVDAKQEVLINDSFFIITEKSSNPEKVTQEFMNENPKIVELGKFKLNDYYIAASAELKASESKVSNGTYSSEITVEHIKPIKFIFN